MRVSKRLIIAGAIAFSIIAAGAYADEAVMRRIEYGVEEASRYHESVRGFIGLSLRVAGVVWIAVEWVAAVYLVRGFALLRRWFAEGGR